MLMHLSNRNRVVQYRQLAFRQSTYDFAMRYLFSCTAAEGHFRPLVPLAQEAASRGHQVVFASANSFRDRVGSAGFELLAAGIDQGELELRYESFSGKLRAIEPGERRPHAFAWRFGAIDAPAKVEELLEAAKSWRPDLIVHESADFAAPLVAEALDIPSVHQGFGRRVPTACFERAAQEVEPLWDALGLSPAPLGGSFRGGYIDICPPSLRPSAGDDGIPVLDMRIATTLRSSATPSWGARFADGKTVYVTLGTMFNDLSVFRVLLDGLEQVDCAVVATVGRDKDPKLLEHSLANAIVEPYIPQDEVLPHVQVTVCHGGSGSMLAALAHGIPMLMIPQGADQFENALACREIGAAVVLMPDELSPRSVSSAVTMLLDDPKYTENARRVAAEIWAMPSPSAVLAILADRLDH
jgi:UDP:flavonoid glycosyltransferase YjiC (YdhE family)